jgi:hypothetical protein
LGFFVAFVSRGSSVKKLDVKTTYTRVILEHK